MRARASRLSGLVLPLLAVANLAVAAILSQQEQGLLARATTPAAPASAGQVAYATEPLEPVATLPPAGAEPLPTVAVEATAALPAAQASVIIVPTVQVATPTETSVSWLAGGEVPAPTVPPTSRPQPANTPRLQCVKQTGWFKYVVVAGDTLYSIAVRAKTSVTRLQTANCLPSDFIRIGDVLLVPQPVYPPTSVPLPSRTPTRWHTATPAPPATSPVTEPPTSTPLSMPTDTPLPPADTPIPQPSDTPPPPPTNTPISMPTDTPPPPPTDLPPPPPTEIPTLEPTP